MKNRTQSKLKLRLTTQIVGTLEGRTTTIGTITATAPVLVSPHVINHVALYVTRKAADHGTTPKKNKKSLKLSSGLPTGTSLVNSITDSTNDSINISWTTRMTISTQKKSLRKLSKH